MRNMSRQLSTCPICSPIQAAKHLSSLLNPVTEPGSQSQEGRANEASADASADARPCEDQEEEKTSQDASEACSSVVR